MRWGVVLVSPPRGDRREIDAASAGARRGLPDTGPPAPARTGGRPLDGATFDAFDQTSFRRLVGQSYARCGNATEAQDCVQEAFVRAWDKRRAVDAEQSPQAWVRTWPTGSPSAAGADPTELPT